MTCLALLIAALGARADTVPPYLAFPEAQLDDAAAYQGYETRVYRDTRKNAVQVYLNRRSGRVVHLWADAADESVGFTARDSAGHPADLHWGTGGATVTESQGNRSVSYALDLPSPVTIGHYLLGSMRVERDLQYAGRDSLSFDSTAFPRADLDTLIANVSRLAFAERNRQLGMLWARTVDDLRKRLQPTTIQIRPAPVTLQISQTSFDGRNHLWLTFEADAGVTATFTKSSVTFRRARGERVRLRVRVTTDAAALTPLGRDAIFNDQFRRFYDAVKADTTHPERFRRLEREVRGMEVLCYREKMMAGLPNFATYFGRDMLMTVLLMRPVWDASMPEHAIASALRKLSPEGAVSHEEALGGQAIREHAAEYNRLIAAGKVAGARAVLRDLQAVRENYIMVDANYQLPVVEAGYLSDARVPAERRRRFLLEPGRLPKLIANLAYVARTTAAYAQHPVPTNLVSFPKGDAGRWISASWRDSRDGYGGGRFAYDVNAIWVPNALAGIGTILDAIKQLGITQQTLDSLAPAIRDSALAAFVADRGALEHAVITWNGAVRHFQVVLAPDQVNARVEAKLKSLPADEQGYWDGILATALPTEQTDSLRFLAVSLDGDGHPVPIVNTDPAMRLLVVRLNVQETRSQVEALLRPYPVGLFVDGLGPVTANDAFASQDVWDAFRQD
ncbi:MAG TPA: hypothetical protein VFJ24_05330, partial [Gaiellales bacterium]|nr:hypothetical protein [Gaiellales bacterium]